MLAGGADLAILDPAIELPDWPGGWRWYFGQQMSWTMSIERELASADGDRDDFFLDGGLFW